jgi:3D (Asp-Asp-Asp) domain-containing protein
MPTIRKVIFIFSKYMKHCATRKIFNQKQVTAMVTAVVCFVAVVSAFFLGEARNVTVFYRNQCQVISTGHTNPVMILQKAGILLNDNEHYQMDETNQGTVLRVSPVYEISVAVDGMLYELSGCSDRVGNILSGLGVQLGEEDIVTPALDTIVSENCNITVQRVSYTTVQREETVNPKVVYEDTDQMPNGVTTVKATGASGRVLVTYEDRMIDGKVAESKPIGTTVVKKAEDRVILRGTAHQSASSPLVTTNAGLNDRMISELEPENPIAVNEKGQPLHFKKKISGKATAYTAADGKHTSTGVVAQVGYIAVDPKEIPYGTMMYIKTADNSYIYGYAKAADTGGFISGSVDVDLFFDTESECIQFGVRDVEIYIL